MAFRAKRSSSMRFRGPLSILAGLHLWLKWLIVGLIVAITIVTIVVKRDKMNLEEHIYPTIIDATLPVLSGITHVTQAISNTWQNATTFWEVRQENQHLKEQLHEMSEYIFSFQDMQAENEALRDILHYAPELTPHYITTKVVGNACDPFIHTVLIAAGSKHGVKKGQVVVNHQGLVGRVTDVSNYVARVLLITDTASRIPVITSTTRERGVLAGSNSSILHMLYLSDDSRLEKGELVYSSGDGSLLPAGILVGAVVDVQPLRVSVEPSVQWNHLEYVKVINY